MTGLRAQVRYDGVRGTWTVTLWNHDARGVPYYFGQRSFPSWEVALKWAVRRVTPSG